VAPRVLEHPGTRPTESEDTVDTTSIRPRSLEVTAEKPKLAVCAGCGERFPRRELVTVHEGQHDGLVFFDGDKVCRPCAQRNGVEF
jgi:hypothetical protein